MDQVFVNKTEDRLRKEADDAAEKALEKARQRGANVDENSDHPFADKYTASGVRYYRSQRDPLSTDPDYKQFRARVLFVMVHDPARGLKNVRDTKYLCDIVASAIRRGFPKRAVVASYRTLKLEGKDQPIPVVAAAVTSKNPIRFSAVRNALGELGSGDVRIIAGTMENLARFVATSNPDDGPYVYGDFKPIGRRGRPPKNADKS